MMTNKPLLLPLEWIFARLPSGELRLEILKLKLAGALPMVPWSDLTSMMLRSCSRWPTESIIQPLANYPGAAAPVLFETPIGTIRWKEAGRQILGILILDQLRGVYNRGPVGVRRGDIVIDLGAALGTFTRHALTLGAGRVIAFEPDPMHVGYLKETFEREIAQDRVVIIPRAAWKEEAALRLSSSGLTSHIAEQGDVEIQATTVDRVVEDLNLSRVDFIKADIEGAERDALLGAARVIARDHPRMALCIYHLPDDPKVIPATVRKFHDAYRVFTNRGRTQAFFSPE